MKCTNTPMHACEEAQMSLHTQCNTDMHKYTWTHTHSILMSLAGGAEASWHGDLFICF